MGSWRRTTGWPSVKAVICAESNAACPRRLEDARRDIETRMKSTRSKRQRGGLRYQHSSAHLPCNSVGWLQSVSGTISRCLIPHLVVASARGDSGRREISIVCDHMDVAVPRIDVSKFCIIRHCVTAASVEDAISGLQKQLCGVFHGRPVAFYLQSR
jgi:hypothetical protein